MQEPPKDVIQHVISDLGPWQVVVCLWLCLVRFPSAWHQLGIIFLAPPVRSWCRRPPGMDDADVDAWRNLTQPPELSGGLESCRRYELNETSGTLLNSTVECRSWEFDRSVFTETIVTEWNLVCDRRDLGNVAQTTFMFGILLGSVLFGMASDRYGRKLPLIMCVVLQFNFGVAAAFVPWFEMFLFCRFLLALSVGGAKSTGFVLCMEFIGNKWRATVSIIYNSPYFLGYTVMAGIAYLLRDWHHFQLAVSAPSVVLLLYWWAVPESPRWLLAAGHRERGTKVLEEAAARNHMDVSAVAPAVQTYMSQKTQAMQNNAKENHGTNILDLFKTPNLRIMTICIYVNFLVSAFCFYGVTEYMGHVTGDIFVNIAVAGLSEVPGAIICMYSLSRFGRKTVVVVSEIIAGLSWLLLLLLPKGFGQVILTSIGITSIAQSITVLQLYATEVFPTVVRNAGFGSSYMCSSIGSMAAPFVVTLGSIRFYLPPLIFGVAPLVAASMCIFLPETKDCRLPETLEDGENFGRNTPEEKTLGAENFVFTSEDSAL